MQRHYDGDKLLEDVNRALEEALGKHGVEIYSLLGVTTVLEAIASPLKLHRLACPACNPSHCRWKPCRQWPQPLACNG